MYVLVPGQSGRRVESVDLFVKVPINFPELTTCFRDHLGQVFFIDAAGFYQALHVVLAQ